MVMSFGKVCFLVFALFVLIMSTSSTQANNAWQSWENIRWSGLQQFTKGNIEAARKWFEQALAEATRVQPGSVNEVISTYDLAQIYDAEDKNQQAEDYCTRALNLSKSACANSHRALITLILSTLADLKSGDKKYDEVAKLEDEADRMADSSVDAQTIGVASMGKDGTIKLDLRADDAGLIGHGCFSYTPSDPEYKATLMHLGPLKPGHQKLVAPWK